MTGTFVAKRLSKSGNYKSALDSDMLFAGADNPNGLFKMVIHPIENCKGQSEIRYLRVSDGYKVSGEAYIVTGYSEQDIDQKIRKHYGGDHYTMLIQREVLTENDLW